MTCELLELDTLYCAVGEGYLYVAKVVGNLDILDGAELFAAEGLGALLPEMEGYHDVFLADCLFIHDKAALIAHGMQACGHAYRGLVPSVEGKGGELVVAIADDGGFGHATTLLDGKGLVSDLGQ